MEQEKVRYMNNNRGSTTIEITLWMPVILLVTVLMITLLLADLQQAKMHSELVVYSVEHEMAKEEGSRNRNDRRAEEEPAVYSVVSKEDDCVVYTSQSHYLIASGYEIGESLEQKIRSVDEIRRLRRWQLLGSAISE